jgi:stringent starvation protein B
MPLLLPQRPYLLRAMHAWMTDNGHTPHLVVDASRENVQVPPGFVRDGKIVLNISHAATSHLDIGNDLIAFNARFGGTPHVVRVPLAAVLGIYARETGRGMIFSDEDLVTGPDEPPGGDGGKDPGAGARRARLKVVK